MFDFGKRLKLLRKKSGITQKQLSNSIGVTERAIVAYESGKMKPNFDAINSLADTFSVSADYLLGRTDTPNSTCTPVVANSSVIEEIRRSAIAEVDRQIALKFPYARTNVAAAMQGA